MIEKYAKEDFLDFLIDKIFPPEDTPTLGVRFRDIVDDMKNNDPDFRGTYKLWCERFDGEFQKYKADPDNYIRPPR